MKKLHNSLFILSGYNMQIKRVESIKYYKLRIMEVQRVYRNITNMFDNNNVILFYN